MESQGCSAYSIDESGKHQRGGRGQERYTQRQPVTPVVLLAAIQDLHGRPPRRHHLGHISITAGPPFIPLASVKQLRFGLRRRQARRSSFQLHPYPSAAASERVCTRCTNNNNDHNSNSNKKHRSTPNNVGHHAALTTTVRRAAASP